MAPKGWQLLPFKEIVLSSQYGISNPASEHGNYRVIGMRNIQESGLDLSTYAKVEISEKEFNNTRLVPGDLLFNRTNSYDLVGKSVLIENDIDATFASYLVRSKLDTSQVIPKFIYYFFNTSHADKILKSLATRGVSQVNINPSVLQSRFKILIPPIEEQRAIVSILNSFSEAIQQAVDLINLKELQKKALMQQLLTGKKRLPGFVGNWRPTLLGEFLKESKIPAIGNTVEKRLTVKLNLKGVEKRDVRGTEMEDGTVYYKRSAGQFIYGKQNLHKGALGIIPPELDGFASTQDIPCFEVSSSVNKEFFIYYLSQEKVHTSLESISTGTGSKRIQPKELFKVSIKMPCINEQNGIVAILQTADLEISLLNRKLNALKLQKKGLLQQLLTGKKRIKP